jgi:hypothetical protein
MMPTSLYLVIKLGNNATVIEVMLHVMMCNCTYQLTMLQELYVQIFTAHIKECVCLYIYVCVCAV